MAGRSAVRTQQIECDFLIMADNHHKINSISRERQTCTRVFMGDGTPLALVRATSSEGQTIREGGTENRGSLGDSRVANWTAQTVRLSVRRHHVERCPDRPQPGNWPSVLGQSLPWRHAGPGHGAFPRTVTLSRAR